MKLEPSTTRAAYRATNVVGALLRPGPCTASVVTHAASDVARAASFAAQVLDLVTELVSIVLDGVSHGRRCVAVLTSVVPCVARRAGQQTCPLSEGSSVHR